MSKKDAFISGIRSLPAPPEIETARRAEEPEGFAAVRFEGDRTCLLDLSAPRASAWRRMIEYLRTNNRPVYVEVDPETNLITELLVPRASRVLRIWPHDPETTYVTFHTSQARHYLRRNHPDYQAMLDALQAALDAGATILVTATFDDLEIIDVRPMPSSFGTAMPPGPPPPSSPDPPVSWDRAVELFNLMNASSCVPCSSASPCIPFKYPRNGCWVRAHLMCYRMVDEDETPEKVWIDGYLPIHTSNLHDCEVTWGWHVAPTLMVQQESGPDVRMVIDPSLCVEPVTVDAWKSLQGDPGALITFSPWTRYWHGSDHDDDGISQAQADVYMEEFRIDLDTLCATYGPPPYACPIVKRSAFIVDRSTFSKDEVEAMLSLGGPAVIDSAFFVVVDGFTPAELGITSATLSGVPDVQPGLTPMPTVAQMSFEVMPGLGLQYPSHLNRRQRITWKYRIRFDGVAGFPVETLPVALTASISTVSAQATLYLVTQPNPYEIDGETSWLSTDLRVFQIRAGESRFGMAMGTDAPGFISGVINNLNSGATGGQTFETISVDQQTSRLELSQTVGGTPVFDFAVAKVRYRALSTPADNVQVLFRLFPASSTSLDYDQGSTYRRAVSGGVVKPLLGVVGGETVTIPCFAAPRVDSSITPLSEQPDPANLRPIPPDSSGQEVVRYFGCWLDINQTQPQFPVNPSSAEGPFAAGDRVSVFELIRNEHQCLVAEIAFEPEPIPDGASPATSDKLAQRNLAIVASANPGDLASHRIPHTFEIKPTRSDLPPGEPPDELMIDWGNTPTGSRATLYLPGVESDAVLGLAAELYRSQPLVRIDAHTLRCEAGGVTYIPIPPGEGSHYAALMTVDLPDTVTKGQAFTIVVRQVTGAFRGRHVPLTHAIVGAATVREPWRRILGTFQITIPVRAKEEILAGEARLLSNLRWIERAIPAGNRWAPVFSKYVQRIAGRVDALGGESGQVVPTATGEWRQAYARCRLLGRLAVLLLAALVIAGGTLSGAILGTAVAAMAVLLAGVTRIWITRCRPGICPVLRALLAGAGLGALGLALLALLGTSTPQLVPTLLASAIVAVFALLAGWRKGCFA